MTNFRAYGAYGAYETYGAYGMSQEPRAKVLKRLGVRETLAVGRWLLAFNENENHNENKDN